MKLIIDRKTWLRGDGSANSYLRRATDGKQCCLGFLAQACGYSEEEITGQSSPCKLFESVRPTENPVMNSLVERHSGMTGVRYDHKWVTNVLMETNDIINDEDAEGEAERERKIAARFSEIGVEVEFVG